MYERQINKLATAERVIEKIQIGRNFRDDDLSQWYNISKIKSKTPRRDEKIPTPRDTILANILPNHSFIHKYVEQDALLESTPETLNKFEENDALMNYYIEENKLLNPGTTYRPLEDTYTALGRRSKPSEEPPGVESPEPMETDAEGPEVQPERMVLGVFKERIFFDVLQKTAQTIYPGKLIYQIWNEYMPIVLSDLFDQLDEMNYAVTI